MAWLTENVDVVGIGIATLAVVISLITVVLQRQVRARDTFLRIHEMLSSSESQEGRRLVYEAGRTGEIPARDVDVHRMNQAVGAYDTVGMYVRRRLVPKRWVLDVWHHSLRDIRAGAMLMADHRQAQHRWRPWPDLWPQLSTPAQS